MNTSPGDVIAEIHGFSDPYATPTPWSVGLEQVVAADTFWLSTGRPDGRPHVTPLIAVWHGASIWFSTGPDERKARNLAENPSCVLTTGGSDLVDGALDVVLEGKAERVTVDAELEPIAAAFAAKYGTETWDYVVREGAFAHRVSGAARSCSACGLCAAWGFVKETASAKRPGASPVERRPSGGDPGDARRARRLGR